MRIFEIYEVRIFRVGQNCIYTPYMTVYLMISLPKMPYIYRIYIILANPTHIVRNGDFANSCVPNFGPKWTRLAVRNIDRLHMEDL